jgi:hypothetical protein
VPRWRIKRWSASDVRLNTRQARREFKRHFAFAEVHLLQLLYRNIDQVAANPVSIAHRRPTYALPFGAPRLDDGGGPSHGSPST